MTFPIYYDSIYTDGLDPEARFPRDRYRLVKAGIDSSRRARNIEFRQPATIDLARVYRVHCRAYVNRFLRGALSDQEARRIGLRPWTDSIVERTLALTGGTVEATCHALVHGGAAANLGGGTHHAHREFGSGYCIFNDLAIAAEVARVEYRVSRILILDLDVHQGDGTATIFSDEPNICTVSVHCGKNFPFRKAASDHDVELEEGAGDSQYLEVLDDLLETVAKPFQPGLILFQAGVDTLQTDRLGHLAMTREGLQKRNRRVFSWAKEAGIPLLVTMGGGYGEPIQTSVQAHMDLFLGAAATIESSEREPDL
ncbi:MAG: histone deacetylase [Verrucomicrobiota bacterium]